MIDLENLAVKRSGELGQTAKEWMSAVRQPVFTEMSSLLTDGEIVSFIASCGSPEILLISSGHYVESSRKGKEKVFAEFLKGVQQKTNEDLNDKF